MADVTHIVMRYINKWADEFINEMASYLYFKTTDNLPVAERIEISKKRFETVKETIAAHCTEYIVSDRARWRKENDLESYLSLYVMDDYAAAFSKDLLDLCKVAS